MWKKDISILSLLFLLDVEMLQASTSNPIPRDGFSRTTKDSMIRKFLEGTLHQWAGKQKEGKRNKCRHCLATYEGCSTQQMYMAHGVIEDPWAPPSACYK